MKILSLDKEWRDFFDSIPKKTVAVGAAISVVFAGAAYKISNSMTDFTENVYECYSVEEVIPETTPIVERDDCTDTEMLASGIYSVIRGRRVSTTTASMVGEVILNRVSSNMYPDTIEDVLLQPYQFGDLSNGFSWSEIKNSNNSDVSVAYSGAEAAMSGSDLVPYNVVFVSDTEQGEVVAMMDGLYFGR